VSVSKALRRELREIERKREKELKTAH